MAGDEVYGGDPELRKELENRRTGMSWPWPVITASPPGARTAPTRSPPVSRRSLAAAAPPARRQGPPLLRLGLSAIRAGQPGMPLAADPPQPPHPGTGVLPLLRARPGPAGRTGHGRRTAVDHRGELPGRQDPHRPGRAPGPPLDLLAPVGHPGHARRRLPHHHRRRRTSPPPAPRDQIPLTRNEISPPAHHHDQPTASQPRQLHWSRWRRRHQYRANSATTTGKQRQTMKITIYSWSTRLACHGRVACGRIP